MISLAKAKKFSGFNHGYIITKWNLKGIYYESQAKLSMFPSPRNLFSSSAVPTPRLLQGASEA
jgi:hypothetical protein